MIDLPENGLIAATFTNLTREGELNLEGIDDYASYLHDRKVIAVMVGGTTGEFTSLTTHERIALTGAWRKAVKDEFAIIAHASHTCQEDARQMAAAYHRAEVDAIALAAPYFFYPNKAQQLVEFFKPIMAAAPETPFYYYYLPSLIPAPVPLEQFLEAADEGLPQLMGVKYTHNDIAELSRLQKRFAGRFSFNFGCDEMYLQGLQAGATRAIGSTYNFLADDFHKVAQTYSEGDLAEAEALQTMLTTQIDAIVDAGPFPLSGLKAMMKTVGIDCGPVRQPLASISEPQFDALLIQLEGIRQNWPLSI